MKIIHRNATAILFEKVSSLGDYHNSWKIIHLQLSGKIERYNHGLRTYFIIKGIAGAVYGIDGYIFLCRDGDIFILFQGSAKPVMDRLAKYFGDIELDYSYHASSKSLYSVYDLSRDLIAFSNMCFVKLVEEESGHDRSENPFYRDAEKVFTEASGDHS